MAHQRPGRSNQGAKADWRGYLLMTTAFIFCPCHLPLILAVVGTTGLLGSWLSQNLTWIGLATAVYFVAALYAGIRLLRRST